jgi:excisionase family DNA binding protein
MATDETSAPRWAGYRDVEKLYGLSRWTILRLWRDDQIRITRVGRRTLVDCASVEEFLERRATETGAEATNAE